MATQRYSVSRNSFTPKTRTSLLSGRTKLIILILIVALAGLGWQYNKARQELKTFNNPDKAAQKVSEDILAEVGKVLVLPSGEQPTIANIGDIEKLKNEPFFKNAQNGDKVLIYEDAKKAIIYRPSTKQIVEMADYAAGKAPETE